MFYPASAADLAAVVDRDLATAATGATGDAAPKAIVVPHAGYVYSGPVAATAYARIAARRDGIDRVVLLGPAHRVPLAGMAVPTVDLFRTPLGDVPIDEEARRTALGVPGVIADDRPGAPEHSLEVQVPFLQRALGPAFDGDGRRRWALLPVVVGRAPTEAVAALLDALWGGDETLVVVSTDLSHYHDHATAQRLDRATAARIVARDAAGIAPEDACGAFPLRGLLELARRRDLPVRSLDLRTSADTAGDPDRVVGYGAFEVAAR